MKQTDLWRVGVVKAPLSKIVAAQSIADMETVWLPAGESLQYMADPFGLWQAGRLYVFVESFDYRTRRGGIDAIVLDENCSIIERRAILREPWHLSYPFVFEADDQIWMLPEAWKSGRLSLYRAIEFPWRWERDKRFDFPAAAIDPTPICVGDEWWLFYTPPAADKQLRWSVLKLARAPHLLGPWRELELPPVLRTLDGGRMGGTPFKQGDTWLLPTQDCRQSYGAATLIRRIADPAHPREVSSTGIHIQAPASSAPYDRGLHTLSAVGDWTLVDVKREVPSWHRLGVDVARHLGAYRARG
ncbi:MAG TPA: hypothetical protein VFQ88_11880 [Nevskiaceae bacterium]|nr:hypothetical protein [Nevskiaceae bacterium]